MKTEKTLGYEKQKTINMQDIQAIITTLTFKKNAEKAVDFYVELFNRVFGDKYGGSKILHTRRYGEKEINALLDYVQAKVGDVLVIRFQLNGQQYMAVNGGDFFNFTEGMSLYVGCDTQEQVDTLYDKLSEGGERQPCGWLKDKWGVSWQIAPKIMREMIEDPDINRSENVMLAIYGMQKINIDKLKEAYKK
jgi:predicted 3-demethylubiquinone-9 3-methyltransferase (glyoxalase superfamily)